MVMEKYAVVCYTQKQARECEENNIVYNWIWKEKHNYATLCKDWYGVVSYDKAKEMWLLWDIKT